MSLLSAGLSQTKALWGPERGVCPSSGIILDINRSSSVDSLYHLHVHSC